MPGKEPLGSLSLPPQGSDQIWSLAPLQAFLVTEGPATVRTKQNQVYFLRWPIFGTILGTSLGHPGASWEIAALKLL